MDKKKQESIETFSCGYNCAQSVLSVFAKELNMSRDACLKLASPFGAGITYMQETCGAVSGALMAIGLKYGRGENGTKEDKERAYDISRIFITEFKKANGTIKCKDLLDGINMSTPEGMAKILELDLFKLNCGKYVQDAVGITHKILAKKL